MRSKHPLYSNKYLLERQQRINDIIDFTIGVCCLFVAVFLTCFLNVG